MSADRTSLDRDAIEPPEPSDPDFRVVLQALIDAYRPILEEDLKRAGDLDALAKEADGAAPDCEAELAAAERLFARFVDEKVAIALLPAQARELLGPVERWRWCLLHIRCCIVFGWLLCRRPRSFRLSAYYLYRYPEKWVGINSYGADLAYTLSRASKDFYIRAGGSMKGDAKAVKHWETGKGGGMWAAGVGGGGSDNCCPGEVGARAGLSGGRRDAQVVAGGIGTNARPALTRPSAVGGDSS